MGKRRRRKKTRNTRSGEKEIREEIIYKKTKIENFRNVTTVIISTLALMVSIFGLVRSNATLMPKFSLEVLMEEAENEENLNRVFKIYNVGGQIVNPQITPVMQLELSGTVLDENGNPDREGFILIGFSDYFSEDYFYNNAESAFIIPEKNANKLYDLLDGIERLIEKEKNCINFFSIKYYFEISYFDYKGKKKNEILYPMNNYAMIRFESGEKVRYFKNNELKKIKNVKEEDILIPIDSENEKFTVVMNGKDGYELQDIKEAKNTEEYISRFIIEYLKEYSIDLNHDESGQGKELTKKKVLELITDDKGFVIGAIEKYNDKNKNVIILLLITILIFFLLSLVFFKRRNRK
ncbi:MAG: hypothetical protein K2M78_08940 [Lachnospiraceae bacterium]|nr:hypothetical protein [Lachnospiraceae bacterium]